MLNYISREEFLTLPQSKIIEIVEHADRPQVGIFISDGNRRLTLACHHHSQKDNDFYHQLTKVTTLHFKQNLAAIFSHGIRYLMVPLLSSAVLKRDSKYLNISLPKGLHTIFSSNEWLDFYIEHEIGVRVYGNLSFLKSIHTEEILDWLEMAIHRTSHFTRRFLFYGIDSSAAHIDNLSEQIVSYYKQYNRKPELNDLIKDFYGLLIPPADFFIMSTKFSGFGAIPPYITNADTQMYFLPSPSGISLTSETFRQILYDYLFLRPQSGNNNYNYLEQHDLTELTAYYTANKKKIIGLGHKIGPVWVADVQ